MTLEQLVKGVREYDHLKNLEISVAMIKQRIEEIIIRGYCERDATDRKVFRYIA
jgi:protein involved in sex pheromone biosynthesis